MSLDGNPAQEPVHAMRNMSFDQLPSELYLTIGSYLKASDLAALAQTSRRSHIVQDMLYDIAVTYIVGPNKECDVERTVLQWAVWQPGQRKRTIAAVVRKGADIYTTGPGKTLLNEVAFRGDKEAADTLVRAGIHPWTSCDGYPPLVHASGGGHEAVVRYLLYDAVGIWQQEALQCTTTCDKRSQFPDPLEKTGRSWALQEGLHLAASRGHVKIVKLLCQHVDVSEPPRDAPFTTSAAEGGSIEIMEILLGLGAKLYPFVLSTAADHGHLPLVQYIISKRLIDITKDYPFSTPLHYAAAKGHADIVRVLLFHGVDHEAENDYETTALELAISRKYDDVIHILADLPITDHGGWTDEYDSDDPV